MPWEICCWNSFTSGCCLLSCRLVFLACLPPLAVLVLSACFTACLQPQLCARASFGVGKVWAAGLLAVRRAQLLATGSWSRSAGGLGESHGVEPTAKTCRSPVGTHFSCLVSLVLLIVGFLNGGRMLSVLPGFWQRFSAFVFYSPSHILASVAIYNTHLRSLYSQQKMTFARLETNTIFFFF